MTDSEILAEVATLVANGLSMARAIRATALANGLSFVDVQDIVNQTIRYSVGTLASLGVA